MLNPYELRGPVAIVWVDNPPVNAISVEVRRRLIEGIQRAATDGAVQGIVIACRGRTFMAGADITEFGKPPLSPALGEVLDAIDASRKPVLAAIHGTAFGGGLEVALACNYRVAVASAQVGLPEVKLGILPGAGGTQRLPRLIGVEKALEIIVTGDPIPAPKAAKLGILDAIIEGELVDGAVQFLQARLGAGGAHRKLSAQRVDPASIPAGFFDAARKRLATQKRNLFSVQRIVDALEAAATLDFDAGMKRERELFAQCQQNLQAKALQYVFFAERKAAKVPNLPADVKPRTIERVAVIGAGTMGGGIAMNFINVGIPVTVLEANEAGLQRGLGVVRKNYENTAAKGKITNEQVEQRMGLIRPTLSYDDLGDADLIIEAVFETMHIKKDVFGKLDKVAKKGAILASNTSYLSIDEIAATTTRPADVLGLHFFSPANVMRLLEIVRGEKTVADTLITALDVARRIKKVGVVAANMDGFIGNRMLAGYSHQAQLLALEGASPQQIDKALFEFGLPMGIFQMWDLAGLDIGYKSRKDRDPESYDQRSVRVTDQLVELGRLGQKTRAGVYDYAEGNRTPIPSPMVDELFVAASAQYGIVRRAIGEQEIVERCLLGLVNVGCEVLRQKVAYRASDIDIVYINGYGFPAYRGGPMFWAENEIGLAKALEKLKAFSAITGERWLTPSPLLEQLVASGKGFASLENSNA
ncbi:MAG: 3-hydroxyacyl-CoA dehydrogenase NAD-binding domain-containing protein [Steroidobacteraceae bacterium]